MHYVDQLSQYLLTDSLKALADGGVQITNVAFTHLSYTRAILGSSSDRLQHIAIIHCPLFKSISAMLNDNSFGLHDTSHLEGKLSRERFLNDLEEGKQIDLNQDFKY